LFPICSISRPRDLTAEGRLSEFSAVGVKGYWYRTVCIAIFWFDLTYSLVGWLDHLPAAMVLVVVFGDESDGFLHNYLYTH
jgi:hypothetical protein